jgi:hypothetical protein
MSRATARLVLGALALTVLAVNVLPTAANAASPQPGGDRLSGIAFLTENQPISGYGNEFRRIKADGANTVSFDVWWVLPNYASSGPVTPVPRLTDSDGDLISAAWQARQAGLKVTLTPKLVIGQNGGYAGWRGSYNPRDPAAFFASYQSMIDHYATVAQRGGMSIFVVGSEMTQSDQYVAYWRQIISSARQRFNGQIAYEVDWREIPQFSFGDAVDVLFLSAYFATSSAERPTLAQLKEGWHSYQVPGTTQTQDAFSQAAGLAHRWNKPIVFGEGGYSATTYPAEEPWWNKPEPPDPHGQYLAYQALLETFADQPWWGGILWWAWNNGVPRTPAGKPAESLIGAQCVAPSISIRSDAGLPSGGPSQVVSAPGQCAKRVVAVAAVHATEGHVFSMIALGTLVLAGVAVVLLGGWLQHWRRRTDELAVR